MLVISSGVPTLFEVGTESRDLILPRAHRSLDKLGMTDTGFVYVFMRHLTRIGPDDGLYNLFAIQSHQAQDLLADFQHAPPEVGNPVLLQQAFSLNSI
jgi:hypothetical protein